MNSHEARKLFDSLSIEGQQAVDSGIFTEYLLSLDPETLAEQIADEIGSASGQHQAVFRMAFAEQLAATLGTAILSACETLRETHREQFNEMTKWRQWDTEDKQNRAHGLTEKGAFDDR